MIIMDYYGYHLAQRQSDLTLNQELFILYGREMLNKEMSKDLKGNIKR